MSATKHAFRALPNERVMRPFVPVSFAARPSVVIFGLVDSGAVGVRADAAYAESLGLDLSNAVQVSGRIAGHEYVAKLHETRLRLNSRSFEWECTVGFIENFGGKLVLGISGFFDHLIVKIDGRKQFTTMTPGATRLGNE